MSNQPVQYVVQKSKRPAHISLTLIADLIAGVFLLAIGVLVFFLGIRGGTYYGLIFAALGIAGIVVAYGLSRAEGWVRIPGIAYGGAILVFGLLVMNSGEYLFGGLGVLLGSWSVFEMNRSKTKSYLVGQK